MVDEADNMDELSQQEPEVFEPGMEQEAYEEIPSLQTPDAIWPEGDVAEEPVVQETDAEILVGEPMPENDITSTDLTVTCTQGDDGTWDLSAAATHDLLNNDMHPDTIAHVPVAGDMIFGNEDEIGTFWDALAVGGDSAIMYVNPATHLPAWFASGVANAGKFLNVAGDGTLSWADGTNAAHTLLDGDVHSDTALHVPVAGDMIFGNEDMDGTFWDALAVGSTGAVMYVAGDDFPAWLEPPLAVNGYQYLKIDNDTDLPVWEEVSQVHLLHPDNHADADDKAAAVGAIIYGDHIAGLPDPEDDIRWTRLDPPATPTGKEVLGMGEDQVPAWVEKLEIPALPNDVCGTPNKKYALVVKCVDSEATLAWELVSPYECPTEEES